MDILQQDSLFQINCIKHQNNPIEFLQTKDIQQDKQLFYCAFCQDEDEEFKPSNYILIKRILQQQDKQVVDKYPPLSDISLYKKFQQCHNQNNQESTLSLKIDQFFENLKSETIKKIDSIKKKMMNCSESFPNNSNNILNKFKELSKINTLKQILTNQNIDFNQKENQFRELMLDLESQKQNNTEILNSLLNQYQQTQNLIDFETPNQIKSQIIQLIDQINIFTFDKNLIDSINSNQNENIYKKNTNLIFDLISTKSNYCSEQFLIQIKSLLNEISPLIERYTFEDIFIEDKKPIDFSNMNKRYLEIINDFTSYFSGLTNKSENQMNEMKNIPEIKQIMNILNLKSNYLKEEYLVELEQYLVETYPLLNKIKFDAILKENNKISIMQEMSEKTLNNVIELIKYINELQRNGDEGNQSLRIKQKVLGQLKEDYDEEDLNKLFQNYPIFDLLNPKLIDILPSMQMIKTNFGQSQQGLQIVKNQNNQISISQNIDTLQASCVPDFILDENTNYVFRFQIINTTQALLNMVIGLVRDSQKDLTLGINDKMSCQIFNGLCIVKGRGIDKKEKGDFSVLRWQQSEIEMRINIKKEILQILDYPNYDHILSISDEFKNNLKEFKNLRLYVALASLHNIQLIYATAKA